MSMFPTPEELGQVLSGFDIHTLLDSDEFSATYHATQTALFRPVALKVLPPSVGANPPFLEAFQAQAKSLAKLNHPNLVSVFDIGAENDHFFMVMDFVSSQSLRAYADDQPLPQDDAVRIVHGICNGLQHAHDNHVTHGALCSKNVLLDSRLNPTVGGFAPTTNNTSNTVTEDITAAGEILHQLLTGYSLPEAGHIPQPSTLCGCDPGLDLILQQLTEYTSISQLGNALKPFSQTQASKKKTSPIQTVDSSQKTISNESALPIKNLLVIAILLIGIFFIWDRFNTKKETVSNLQKEIDTASNQPKKPVAKEPTIKNPVVKIENEPAVPTKQKEAPKTYTLEELKSALASGQRDRYPEGSISIGDSVFYHLNVELDWYSAIALAESYGAHLACLDQSFKILEINLLVPDGKEAWLGGGYNGRHSWTWIDGSIFVLDPPAPKNNHHIITNQAGELHSRPSTSKLTVLIQWRKDGSNPGTLDESLKRADSTYGVYPPGTLSLGSRKYYLSRFPLNKKDARLIASKSGGHLAIASEQEELLHFQEIARNELPSEGAFFLGGSTGAKISWDNDELWKIDEWEHTDDASANEGSITMHKPKDGSEPSLKSRSVNEELPFLIVWSDDPQTNTAAASPLPPELKNIRNRAKQKLQEISQIEQNALIKNSKALTLGLSSYMRRFPKNTQKSLEPKITIVRNSIKQGGKIDPLHRSVTLPPKLQTLYDYHLDKQQDSIAQTELTTLNLRKAYLTRLDKLTSEDVPKEFLTLERERIGDSIETFTSLLQTSE